MRLDRIGPWTYKDILGLTDIAFYPSCLRIPWVLRPSTRLLYLASFLVMYIPFASLLSIQAALESFGFDQPAQEPDSITPVHFINPKPGGGSFLDKDSGGLGEPLNVSSSFG